MMFSVDGIEWDIPCTIERRAEVRSSEISGMLLNRNYFNDVLGTYMTYTVAIAIPKGKEQEYANLYEALTEPTDGHRFVFPYNQSTITITGSVNVVSDRYYRKEGSVRIWRGTKFTVTANNPSKKMTLDEVITAGMTPAPSVYDPQVGDTYTYTENGWELVE